MWKHYFETLLTVPENIQSETENTITHLELLHVGCWLGLGEIREAATHMKNNKSRGCDELLHLSCVATLPCKTEKLALFYSFFS